jgi:hypothetical protein
MNKYQNTSLKEWKELLLNYFCNNNELDNLIA